ncbi:MAG: DUF6519 domain-containing protein [Caldilinea sp.]|nr:DUF6519 domain-containing protein [Caldilinea sp.]MDW8439115.1 DUF6519 domain-containing protein [Caldilineaceae bacterium]
MQGDFTRWTFDRSKHYSGVLNQQGRVALDADWNEQVAIEQYDGRTTRKDVLGLCGGPQGVDAAGEPLAGFDVTTDGVTLIVTKGRYYVAGLRAEKEQTTSITAQPDLPVQSPAQVAGLTPNAVLSDGAYLAYLDVWERHITALEDASIREVALGGPDTTTRTQVMAQVKLLRVGDAGVDFTCAAASAAWDALTAPSSGMLAARAEPADPAESACVVPAKAGYRGLENQLYRVEVHRMIAPNRVGLKWSRENASIAVRWTGQDNLNPNRLTVSSTGRDGVLGLAADQWIELTDDAREKRNESGLLVKIVQVEGNVLTIDPGGQSVLYSDFGDRPKIRRWDMAADEGELEVILGAAAFTELEQGVQIRLTAGVYRPGDYWLIPARTASGDIEWPRTAANPPQPIPQPPLGVRHAYCKLALFDFVNGAWSKRSDCRHLFPPLTEMIRFYGVGGDGQEALPGAQLGQPLEVAVMNGQQPVNNARVRFRLVPQNAAGQLTGTSGSGKNVDVTVGVNGVYSCTWQLGPTVQNQRVEAFLVEIDGKPFVDSAGEPLLPRFFFNANLSKADQVAYMPGACADLAQARTVQEALDILCARPRGGGCCITVGEGGDFPDLTTALKGLLERGERNLCLCLLRGDHTFAGFDFEQLADERGLQLEIKGCVAAAQILWREPLRLRGVDSVTLRGLSIELAFVPDKEDAALRFDRCDHVTIADCIIEGTVAPGRMEGNFFVPGGALVAVDDGDAVRLSDNALNAALPETFPPLRNFFDRAKVGELAELFALAGERVRLVEWRAAALRAAKTLANANVDNRRRIAGQIQETMRAQEAVAFLSGAEAIQISKLIFAFNGERVAPDALFDILDDLRLSAVKARAGTAMMLNRRRVLDERELQKLTGLIAALDEDDFILLENNRIAGVVSLYGMPGSPEMIAQMGGELLKLDARPNEPGGSRLTIAGAFLGTLQLRGNQLVRLAIGHTMLEELRQRAGGEGTVSLAGDVFARLLLDGNVFEGMTHLTLGRHLNVQANEFTQTAAPAGRAGLATGAVRMLGWFVADSATYIGNQGVGEASVLVDIARLSERMANLQLRVS